MIWGEAIKARVIQLWETHTSAQIAAEMAKDGISMTRNSVIGILHRGGMSIADKNVVHPKTRNSTGKKKPRLVVKVRREVTLVKRSGPNTWKTFQGVLFDLPEPAPIDVEPLNISLLELTDSVCHAVTRDGPDWGYCGRDVFKRSYCWHHFGRYYNLPEKRFGAPGFVAEVVA